VNARVGAMEIAREIESRERETVTVVLSFEAAVFRPSVEAPSEQGRSGWPPLAYVGFGVGAAGIAVGSIAGLLAISSQRLTESKCSGDLCPPSAWADVDRTRSYMTVSTVGFAAGIVGAGVGIGSLIWQTPKNGTTVRIGVRPVAGGVYLVGQY
jgi:hypothetical protein